MNLVKVRQEVQTATQPLARDFEHFFLRFLTSLVNVIIWRTNELEDAAQRDVSAALHAPMPPIRGQPREEGTGR